MVAEQDTGNWLKRKHFQQTELNIIVKLRY